jgi:methionyl-tRNA synthetase
MEAAVGEVISLLTDTNKYIDKTKPWQMLKDEKLEEAGEVLYSSMEALRIATILLHPVMPDTTGHVLKILGQDSVSLSVDQALQWGLLKGGSVVRKQEPIFKRL